MSPGDVFVFCSSGKNEKRYRVILVAKVFILLDQEFIVHLTYHNHNYIFHSLEIQWYNEHEMPFHAIHETHYQIRIGLLSVFHTMELIFTVINLSPIQAAIQLFRMK